MKVSMVVNLKELKNDDIISGGLVYLSSYSKKSYANGAKSFIAGNLRQKEAVVAFNIWDAKLVEILANNNAEGVIAKISGTVGMYQDKLQVTIQSVDFGHGFTDMTQFLKSVDVPTVFTKFTDFINEELSQKGVSLILNLFKSENLFGAFKTEYAGVKMHDAQVGGLMNHTLKMLNIAKILVANDSRLDTYKDKIYLGIILHDVGKVYELSQGKYTDVSFVTHRILGVELIAKYKVAIIDLIGERDYYHLLAIVQGHHGEWGDAPTTVWAQLIHYIDLLESFTTGALDKIDAGDVSKTSSGLESIYHNTGYLVI